MLGAVPAQLIVPEEAERGDGKGAVAEREPHVLEAVRLLELERVEVVGDRIVRGVLEILKASRVRCTSGGEARRGREGGLPARL